MNQRGASDMSHALWECSAMNGLYRPQRDSNLLKTLLGWMRVKGKRRAAGFWLGVFDRQGQDTDKIGRRISLSATPKRIKQAKFGK